ncbi:MAG: hypothetical protein HC887_10300 [Desulfobacteraceae bacterium]|nr:hypothetical protein [Desulfobacteraceae bacterium]
MFRRNCERRKADGFFGSIGISLSVRTDTLMIAATDCSFIPESGSRTYGLAKFYNSKASEAGKGLGISEPAAADVNYNTA